MFKSFLTLSTGLGVAALLPAAALWLCDRLGWLSFDRVLAVSLSPAFLLVSTAAVIATLLLGSRSAAADAEGYSGVDRALHRVAFATYEVQADLADIEDRLFASHLGSITNQRPVFITSLPRAGTTLLLECCAALDEFASHTYRDMPFVMIPCLWSSFSGAFRREGQLKPRAHGDGMQIDFDSPEALEEVLWLKFWEKQYRADRVVPWPSRPRQEFTTFFARHMRKIAFVRRGDRADGVRYISKNNLNIARIPLVRQMFPDATIVVPVRAPLDHCSSLLQQHRQFSELHARDAFASRYMRAIGHFDFGEHLRPVDFDRWYDGRAQKDALTLSFWLEYLGGGLSASADDRPRAGALPRLRPAVRRSRPRAPAPGGADRLPGCGPPAGVGGGNSAGARALDRHDRSAARAAQARAGDVRRPMRRRSRLRAVSRVSRRLLLLTASRDRTLLRGGGPSGPH